MQTVQVSRRKRVNPLTLLVAGVLFGAIMLVLGVLWANRESSSETLNPGEMAPAFVLQDQDGRDHKLEDYHNRPVVLAFLPDLNGVSMAQLKSLNSKIRQFDTLGAKVFGVVPGEPTDAKRVHDTEHLNFPILVDKGQQVSQRYKVSGGQGAERRVSYVIDVGGQVLLPVTTVQIEEHGQQLIELTECCLDTKPQAPSPYIGKPIADFHLPTVVGGKQESLYGDNKQKATVLIILSSECPCSKGYDARLTELTRNYGAKGVRFIAMNASSNETPEEIAKYATKVGYPFPVLKDAGNIIADRIEAQVTPEAFVMDAKGVLRYHGRIDDNRNPVEVKSHDLRNALDFMLTGQNPPYADVTTFGCAIFRAPKPVGKNPFNIKK